MSMRDSRLWLIVGGVVAVVVLFLVLRPSDDEDAAATTPAAPAATAAETTETATEPPATTTAPVETAPEPEVQRFTATIANGAVTGGIQRWQVAQDDQVRIVVRSDVDDELHLHGYDIEKTVGPGRPAIFAFPATLPGRFELEAHHGGGQIAQLDVQP